MTTGTMSGSYGLAALAALAALGASGPAAAQDRAEWSTFLFTTRVAGAAIGVPETDDVRFSLRCEDGTVTLDPQLFVAFPAAETPALRFLVDGRAFIRGARFADRNQMAGAYPIETVVNRNDPLLPAMRAGSELTTSVHPEGLRSLSSTVTLSGSSDAIAEMLANC